MPEHPPPTRGRSGAIFVAIVVVAALAAVSFVALLVNSATTRQIAAAADAIVGLAGEWESARDLAGFPAQAADWPASFANFPDGSATGRRRASCVRDE